MRKKKQYYSDFNFIILIMMKTNCWRCAFSSNTILGREIVKCFVITLCYLNFKIFSGTKQLLLTVLPTEWLNWNNVVMWKRNELQSLTPITITKPTKPFLAPKLKSQCKPISLSHSTFAPFLLSHSHSPISNSFQLSARRTSPLDPELLQEPPHCSRNTCCTHIFHAPSLP